MAKIGFLITVEKKKRKYNEKIMEWKRSPNSIFVVSLPRKEKRKLNQKKKKNEGTCITTETVKSNYFLTN